MRTNALFLAVGLCVTTTASAQSQWTSDQITTEVHESERTFLIELNGGRYVPEIANESGLSDQPYRDIFGDKKMWLFEGELDYQLYNGFGTAAVGLAAGYGVVFGHGLVARTGEESPDTTALKTVPIRALAIYRFDWLWRELGVPLVPFGKVGLAHTIWWVTNGRDGVATYGDDGKAFGGKWGYELAAGLAFPLNFLDPSAGRDFDRDWGVNAAYIHAQYVRLTANNFGGEGLDLSDSTFLFGLGFEF